MKLRFSAAGTKFYNFDDVKDLMVVGTPVELEPEPENKYDDTAVAISYLGQMLGYDQQI